MLTLKNILNVSNNLKEEVRVWRNDEEVRKYMYNTHIIKEEEHKKWLEKLEKDNKNKVFVVFYNEEPVGIVSANKIDTENKTCEWAFYLSGKDLRGRGIGSLLELKFLDYMFLELRMEKVNAEVLETNPTVISLHKKFGFKVEGIRRQNIIRENKRLDIYLIGMLKEEWLEKRNELEIKIMNYSNGS